jgi:hypothetical protein
MTAKAPVFYQGSDWFTHRWTIAQAYETLDRIHDLCRCRAWDRVSAHSREAVEAMKGINALCDMLEAEMAIAEADLKLFAKSNAAQGWAAIEARLHLCALRQQVTRQPSVELFLLFETVLALAARLRATLKQMDQ